MHELDGDQYGEPIAVKYEPGSQIGERLPISNAENTQGPVESDRPYFFGAPKIGSDLRVQTTTSRTAVYGLACTVVWEGERDQLPPMPIYWTKKLAFAAAMPAVPDVALVEVDDLALALTS